MKQKKEHRYVGPNNHKRIVTNILITMMVFVLPLLCAGSVSADGGMISFHEFSVYEPGQKAIIAWDGTDEIMILSVDVYSEENTQALHMVPFPSLPEVELGSVESFEKIEEIMNRDGYYHGQDSNTLNEKGEMAPGNNVEIVFWEQIGPHDITAVKINSPIEFTKWVNEFLEGKGIINKELPDELDSVVSHYTGQEIRYFVFDVINLTPNEKSVDPIIYKFKSRYLFFPLEISSIIEGYTEITLAFITPSDLPISSTSMEDLNFNREYNGMITLTELEEVSDKIAAMFMFAGDCCLAVFKGFFSLTALEDDIMIKRLSNVNWMHTEGSNYLNCQVYDANNDGDMDVILATDEKLFIFDGTGGHLEHECELTGISGYNIREQLVTDVNSDGVVDVIKLTWNDEIYLNDGGTGEILKVWDMGDNGISSIRYIFANDLNDDGKTELIISDYNGKLMIFNMENKEEVGSERFQFDVTDVKVGNVAAKPGVELVCRSGNDIYVLEGGNGNLIWDTKTQGYNWKSVQSFNLIDLDNDGELEVTIFSYPDIYIIDGNDGTVLQKVESVFDLGKKTFLSNLEIIDLDKDGEHEIIAQSHDKLYVYDLENGTHLWEFTTGDDISDFEVADIDGDGQAEIIMTTGNKFYAIEYVQEPPRSNDDVWDHNHTNLLAAIILPFLIIITIVIVMFKIKALRNRNGNNHY